MTNTINYTFTPEQVKKIVETLMQFPAAQTYDTIKLIDNEIIKQNAANENLVATQNE